MPCSNANIGIQVQVYRPSRHNIRLNAYNQIIYPIKNDTLLQVALAGREICRNVSNKTEVREATWSSALQLGIHDSVLDYSCRKQLSCCGKRILLRLLYLVEHTPRLPFIRGFSCIFKNKDNIQDNYPFFTGYLPGFYRNYRNKRQISTQHHSVGIKRYPTPCTVSIYRGSFLLSFSLRRTFAIILATSFAVWLSSSQIAGLICSGVSTSPAFRIINASRRNSWGVK